MTARQKTVTLYSKTYDLYCLLRVKTVINEWMNEWMVYWNLQRITNKKSIGVLLLNVTILQILTQRYLIFWKEYPSSGQYHYTIIVRETVDSIIWYRWWDRDAWGEKS